MIIWKYLTEEHSVIGLAIRPQSTNVDITLTISSDQDLENAFLYTTSDWLGVVSAKLPSQDNYYDVQAYSITPTCFIGNLIADEEVTINFRLNFSASYFGEQIIPILVGYGSDITSFYFNNENIFWYDNSTIDPFFWYDTSEEVDEGQWFHSS